MTHSGKLSELSYEFQTETGTSRENAIRTSGQSGTSKGRKP